MKILVTGSNGQVGQSLVKQLNNEADITFLALDKENLDITNKEAVEKVVQEFSPDVIVNTAAYTAVDKAESEPEIADLINHIGPYNLAIAANIYDATLIHISTDYVFSGESMRPYDEKDTTAPRSIYGKSKLAGEAAIANACPHHIILRTAWVFGEYGNNFVKTMLRLAKTRDCLGVVDDQLGGPTYAGDIAKALIVIAKKVVSNEPTWFGTYHYSGLPHVSWCEFATDIFKQAYQQELIARIPTVDAISTDEFPTPARRPANSCLNTSLVENKFNLQASDWKQALKDLTAYVE
ncbi:dTDP-4-dehydrorhamnose reductase [Vibrio europaeus]|nr:dTDP-4-dehydrorhamnose reductase [Vibrio europaeus]MDC5703124.1 dTDP-4-dehydrorhamnose reductase [Vibrio europaeus]MDC5708644.1 dTDP-4-dehydrorhamnose reductase [Vibrio europaeus]MDC5713016.1 dTDP-4-dehydrorhamnose reductase [Vibrio europaeus]MDC5718029.1 dTDP-4-dehydrorhamnose reductase [Vibrio europaeus]MDC5725436.1 dTDP-4-dehydrorhamnose reductase [Vibrio europaeus]